MTDPLPAAAYVRNTGLTISSASWTTLDLATEDLDGAGFHDPVTNTSRLTVPNGFGGYYIVVGYTLSTATHTGYRGVRIRKNGSTVTATFEYAGSNVYNICAAPVWDLLELDIGEYVEVQGWQDSGSDRSYDVALLLVKLRVEQLCYAAFSGSQIVASGGFVDAPESLTETIDTGGWHSDSTNPSRITVGASGKYLILAAGGWAAASDTTVRGIRLLKNGSAIPGTVSYIIPSSAVNEIGVQTFAIADLSANDYIQLSHRQLSGADETLTSSRLCVIAIGDTECGYATGSGTAAVGAGGAFSSALDLDGEQVDTDGWHSDVTNPSRFTCQHAGTFFVLGKTQLAGPQYIAGADLLLNGSNIGDQGQLPGNNGYAVSPIQARALSLAVNDYLEIRAYSGDTADTVNRDGVSVMFAHIEELAAQAVTFRPQIIRRR